MGGLRETEIDREEVIDLKQPKGSAKPVIVGKLEIHENKGEVHFHNRETGQKCAVEAAAYWSFWDKLKAGGMEIPYVSTLIGKDGMAVRLSFYWNDNKLDVAVSILEQGDSLKALDNFVVKA